MTWFESLIFRKIAMDSYPAMLNFARPEPQDGFDFYDQKLWLEAEEDGFFDINPDEYDDTEPA